MNLKIATVVMFGGGIVSAFNRDWEIALIFLSTGFGLVYCFETNIQWQQPLDRKHLLKDLTETKWQVTAVGQLSQFLSFIFLVLFFIVHFS